MSIIFMKLNNFSLIVSRPGYKHSENYEYYPIKQVYTFTINVFLVLRSSNSFFLDAQ